ncbi:amidohydrolase family protein [Alphaproteobacteria bacterium]|nr:amidohydrolase family protein [Alphaproteobacteria bacterium]
MAGSLIIRKALIISGKSVQADQQRQDILVEDGIITAIEPSIPNPNQLKELDATDMLVMPGFVNAHIHTWQTGLRGLAGDWTATNYFRAMHAGLATFFEPEDIYIANLVGALNQINNGVTTLVDWHHCNRTPDHSDAAIDGLMDSGIRAVFMHGTPKPDAVPGQPHFSEVPMPADEVARLRHGRLSSSDNKITMGLAILGPQMAINDVCMKDFTLAKEMDLVASMHHSSSQMVSADGYEMVSNAGLLGNHINIVHGNELLDKDLDILVEGGVTFTVTAEVEMQMSFGNPLSARLLQKNHSFSIGSDVESAYSPDMFAIARTTMQVERHFMSREEQAKTGERPHPIPITTADAFNWATLNGAKDFRLDKITGSLEVGKRADITFLRNTDLNLKNSFNPLHSVVCYAHPGNVDTVIIEGDIMKQDGQLKFANLVNKLSLLETSGRKIYAEFKARAATAEFG